MGSESAKLKEIEEMAANADEYAKKNLERRASSSKETSLANDEEFKAIKENAFYKILVADKESSPEEKKKAVTEALKFEGTKEENLARIAEFEKFKEFLNHLRKKMALEVLSLTDTEAFAELKSVYEELGNDLNDFDNAIEPLVNTLEAFFKIRTKGGSQMIFDLFNEIENDKKETERLESEKLEQEARLENEQRNIKKYAAAIREQESKKAYWGLLGDKLSSSAIKEKARLQALTEDTEKRMEDIQADIKGIQEEIDAPRSTILPDELLQYKDDIVDMLKIDEEGHIDRQKELVQTGEDFIMTTDTKVRRVRNHLQKMNGQIEKLSGANSKMRSAYAVLHEASKDALKHNNSLEGNLKTSSEGESTLDELEREDKLRDVQDYVKLLDSSAQTTLKTYAQLQTEGAIISAAKEKNNDQVHEIQELYTSGVAGVASKINMVTQNVTMSALHESSKVVESAIEKMRDKTTSIASKDAIQSATMTMEDAERLDKTMADLEVHMAALKKASNIRKMGSQKTKSALEDFVKTIEKQRETIKEHFDTASEGVMPTDDAPSQNKKDGEEPSKKSDTGYDEFGL